MRSVNFRAFQTYLKQNRQLTQALQHRGSLEQEVGERTTQLKVTRDRHWREAAGFKERDWVKAHVLEIALDLRLKIGIGEMASTFLSRRAPPIQYRLGADQMVKTPDLEAELGAQRAFSIVPSYG